MQNQAFKVIPVFLALISAAACGADAKLQDGIKSADGTVNTVVTASNANVAAGATGPTVIAGAAPFVVKSAIYASDNTLSFHKIEVIVSADANLCAELAQANFSPTGDFNAKWVAIELDELDADANMWMGYYNPYQPLGGTPRVSPSQNGYVPGEQGDPNRLATVTASGAFSKAVTTNSPSGASSVGISSDDAFYLTGSVLVDSVGQDAQKTLQLDLDLAGHAANGVPMAMTGVLQATYCQNFDVYLNGR